MTPAPAKKKETQTLDVHLFTGQVDSRRDAEVSKMIADRVDSGSEMFDLSRFEGDEASAESIIGAAMTLPLSSDKKVVVVSRIDRLAPDDQVRVAAFIPKMGPMSCLVMMTSEDAVSARGKAKDDDDSEDGTAKKRKKGLQPELKKAVTAHGKVVDFAKMKSDTLAGMVAKAVQSTGKKIDPPALQSLSYSLASNPASVPTEVMKLSTYVGDRDRITLDDVDEVIIKSPEERTFPLIDALGARRADKAIDLLNETMAAVTKIDSEVLKLLSMLAKHFRMMLQVKFLRSQGVRNLGNVPEHLLELLPDDGKLNPLALSDWQLGKLAQQAESFTQDELEQALRDILTCELACKGIGDSAGSPRLHLEVLVFKLSRRTGR